MKIKYRTGFGCEIEEIEIIRETAKQVVYVVEGYKGVSNEIRSNKKSKYENWFNSFNEAKDYLINKYETRILGCKTRLAGNEHSLMTVKGLVKKPV